MTNMQAAYINANKAAYYEYWTTTAKTLVNDFRKADVDMYYMNQAEKFAAGLRFIAKDDDVFGIDYFNEKFNEGLSQIKGWTTREATPLNVKRICNAFIANFN